MAYNERPVFIPSSSLELARKIANEKAGHHMDLAERHLLAGDIAYAQIERRWSDACRAEAQRTGKVINGMREHYEKSQKQE